MLRSRSGHGLREFSTARRLRAHRSLGCLVGKSRLAPQTPCIALIIYGALFALTHEDSSYWGVKRRNAVCGSFTAHGFHSEFLSESMPRSANKLNEEISDLIRLRALKRHLSSAHE